MINNNFFFHRFLFLNVLYSHQSRGRLSDLVAEHLDHLHYVNDILCLSIDNLNEVLVEQLFQRLLIPLYIHSLDKGIDFAYLYKYLYYLLLLTFPSL